MKPLISLLGLLSLASGNEPAAITMIHPGEVWPDTEGKPEIRWLGQWSPK